MNNNFMRTDKPLNETIQISTICLECEKLKKQLEISVEALKKIDSAGNWQEYSSYYPELSLEDIAKQALKQISELEK